MFCFSPPHSLVPGARATINLSEGPVWPFTSPEGDGETGNSYQGGDIQGPGDVPVQSPGTDVNVA